MQIEKPHLSATQLDMYCRCPEQYRRRYLEKEILPPGIAILKGIAFHQGAEINMRQKIDSHADLPVSDIVDTARAAFDASLRGDYALSVEEQSQGSKIVLGKAVNDTVEMVTVHAKQQAPDYQPVLVEELVRIILPNSPRDLMGIIDLADDQRRVVDFKTAGKKKSQADADDSVQLTVYAAAYHAKTGDKPAELRLDSVVQTKTKTERQVVTSSRNENDFAPLVNRINTVNRAIDSGSFPPASPGSWWCSPKWCGFWNTCPYVNSQRIALAKEE